jgi:hypothetical protein
VDVIHTIRISLIPVLTGVNPYELTLGSHITTSKQYWSHEYQKELIHIEFSCRFIRRLRIQRKKGSFYYRNLGFAYLFSIGVETNLKLYDRKNSCDPEEYVCSSEVVASNE